MSDETRVSGWISITPPVPAHRLAGSGFVPGSADDERPAVRLCTDSTASADSTGGADGTDGAERAAWSVAIEAAADEDGWLSGAHDLVPDLNRLLALIGPGHRYDGVISCAGPAGDEDLWRVRVVDGVAVGEDAEVVYPADWTAPAGPAVLFNPTAARDWLRAHVPGRTDGPHPDPAGGPASFGVAQQPSDVLCRLLAALGSGAVPHVWRCQPQVRVEVVGTMDPLGVPNGGAVLIVTVAGVRLASKPVTARELAGCDPISDDPNGDLDGDGRGRGRRSHEDVAVAVLGRAAQIATLVVQRYRTAQMAVPPYTVEQAMVLLDALRVLHRSDVQPWTSRRELPDGAVPDGAVPGSVLLHRSGYQRTMRGAAQVLHRLIDRRPVNRSGLCWHSVADFDRHGVPGIKQVAVSRRCAYDGCAVTCWVVDRSGDGWWRVALIGSDDGQIVAETGAVVGDTYPDELIARQAAELFEAAGSSDPTGPTFPDDSGAPGAVLDGADIAGDEG